MKVYCITIFFALTEIAYAGEPQFSGNPRNDHFLQEAAWILCTYGRQYAVWGLVIAAVMVVWGARRMRRASRMAVLAAATLVLWIALIFGIESGYHAWQTIPNPPEEAFSDTGGPFSVLLLGWLPSLVVLGILHLLLRYCWQSFAPPSTSQPGPSSRPA